MDVVPASMRILNTWNRGLITSLRTEDDAVNLEGLAGYRQGRCPLLESERVRWFFLASRLTQNYLKATQCRVFIRSGYLLTTTCFRRFALALAGQHIDSYYDVWKWFEVLEIRSCIGNSWLLNRFGWNRIIYYELTYCTYFGRWALQLAEQHFDSYKDFSKIDR